MATRFLLLSFLLWSHVSFAANDQGRFQYLAHGTHSCGKFIEAVTHGNNSQNWIKWNGYLAYTSGYLTGFNKYVNDTVNIAGNTDMEGVMAFIEKHCRKNPLDDYYDAVNAVVTKLYPNRKK